MLSYGSFVLRCCLLNGVGLAYSAQDIQHEVPARAYGVAFGIYIVEGPIHAYILLRIVHFG